MEEKLKYSEPDEQDDWNSLKNKKEILDFLNNQFELGKEIERTANPTDNKSEIFWVDFN